MWRAPADAPGSPVRSPRLTPRALAIQGAVVAEKYSALEGRGFSRFVYESEPVERRRQPSPRQQQPVGGGRAGFKHCALPPAPKQAGTFQRFRYSIDPFEEMEARRRAEVHRERSKTLNGAFSAGGNARDPKRALKLRLPELRAQLVKTLRADLPSFVRVVLDERGVLLCLFAAERLNAERRTDLHAYMNRLLKTHPMSTEFGLQREPTRWGVAASVPGDPVAAPTTTAAAGMPSPPPSAETVSMAALPPLVYAFRPPWVAALPCSAVAGRSGAPGSHAAGMLTMGHDGAA